LLPKYDPVERDLEIGFMPWIIQQTLSELNQLTVGRLLLDSLLRNVVTKREEDYAEIEEKLKQLAEEDDGKPNLSPEPNITEEVPETSNQDEVKIS